MLYSTAEGQPNIEEDLASNEERGCNRPFKFLRQCIATTTRHLRVADAVNLDYEQNRTKGGKKTIEARR